jgi:hypothetical protein
MRIRPSSRVRWFALFGGALAAASLLLAAGREAYGQPPTERPAYQKLRFEEDWSFLAETKGKDPFDRLFPTGHAYLGYIDMVGRQNIVDLRGGASIDPLQSLDFALDLHNFWRAEDEDALYSPGGAIVRSGSAGSSNYVGTEIDLTIRYRMDHHISWQAGYSHFLAGDFIEESGSSHDVDFGYLMGLFTF